MDYWTLTASAAGRSIIDAVFGTFSMPRRCVYVDKRLGLYYFLGATAVVVFGVQKLFVEQQFLTENLPYGLRTIWVTSTYDGPLGKTNYHKYQDAFTRALEQRKVPDSDSDGYDVEISSDSLASCDTSEYDFKFDESFTYSNFHCELSESPALMWNKNFDNLFIKTSSLFTQTSQVQLPKAAECTAELVHSVFPEACVSSGPTKVTLQGSHASGTCQCHESQHILYHGAEYLTLHIDHRFSSSIKEGKRPKTTILANGESSDLVFEKGEILSLPLWKLLEVADVDLGRRHDASHGLTGTDPATGAALEPYMRITGVTLELSLQYLNYKWMDSKLSGMFWEREPECVITITPQFVWSSTGNKISHEHFPAATVRDRSRSSRQFSNEYDYGLAIITTSHGVIGRFNFVALLSALVDILVLLNLVTIVVGFIAHNLSGDKSETYASMAVEQIDFEKEYARFAVGLIPILNLFGQLDHDHDGSISPQELRLHVINSFKGIGMTKDEVESLCNLIMNQADTEPAFGPPLRSPGRDGIQTFSGGNPAIARMKTVGDGQISKTEFVNIFHHASIGVGDLISLLRTEVGKKGQSVYCCGGPSAAFQDIDDMDDLTPRGFHMLEKGQPQQAGARQSWQA